MSESSGCRTPRQALKRFRAEFIDKEQERLRCRRWFLTALFPIRNHPVRNPRR